MGHKQDRGNRGQRGHSGHRGHMGTGSTIGSITRHCSGKWACTHPSLGLQRKHGTKGTQGKQEPQGSQGTRTRNIFSSKIIFITFIVKRHYMYMYTSLSLTIIYFIHYSSILPKSIPNTCCLCFLAALVSPILPVAPVSLIPPFPPVIPGCPPCGPCSRCCPSSPWQCVTKGELAMICYKYSSLLHLGCANSTGWKKMHHQNINFDWWHSWLTRRICLLFRNNDAYEIGNIMIAPFSSDEQDHSLLLWRSVNDFWGLCKQNASALQLKQQVSTEFKEYCRSSNSAYRLQFRPEGPDQSCLCAKL